MTKLYFLILLFVCGTLSAAAQTWVIDAGHGGYDSGCEGANTVEKDITLRVAQEVARLVRANLRGVKVVMTRNDDRFVSLENRCYIANNARADLFLSIHVNAAGESGSVRGTESYYGPMGGTLNAGLEDLRRTNIGKSEMLARLIQRSYAESGRPSTRGVKQERYWVVLHTQMPSVLTEVGFISTQAEEDFLGSDEGVRSTAQSIYNALRDYRQAVRGNNVSTLLADLRRHPFAAPARGDLAYAAPRRERNTTPAAAPTPTRTTTPEPAPAPARKATRKTSARTTNVMEFRVQLCSVKAAISETDSRLKGVSPVRIIQSGNGYKCYYGSTPDYAEARTMQQEMEKLFPGAFIVAYKDGEQIPLYDARRIYKDYLK